MVGWNLLPSGQRGWPILAHGPCLKLFEALKSCTSCDSFRASLASLVSVVKGVGWGNFGGPSQRSARPHHRGLNHWMRMGTESHNLLEEDPICRSVYVINNIGKYCVICIFA
jgi:hypothetical protein